MSLFIFLNRQTAELNRVAAILFLNNTRRQKLSKIDGKFADEHVNTRNHAGTNMNHHITSLHHKQTKLFPFLIKTKKRSRKKNKNILELLDGSSMSFSCVMVNVAIISSLLFKCQIISAFRAVRDFTASQAEPSQENEIDTIFKAQTRKIAPFPSGGKVSHGKLREIKVWRYTANRTNKSLPFS